MKHTAIVALSTIIFGCDPERPDTERFVASPASADVTVPILPVDFAAELDAVTIDVQSDGSTVVTAHNIDGEIIGRLGLIDHGGGIWRASSAYADGSSLVDIDIEAEEVVSVELTGLAPEEIEHRARLIEDMIGSQADEPQAFNPWDGWAGCGVGVGLTIVYCVPTPATLWKLARCPITAAGATCACVKAANNGKAKKPCGKEK